MRLALLFVLSSCACAQHWKMQDSHIKESFRGVSVVNANVIWASGTHGTYILTTDGGKTWVPHQVPGAEALDFRGVKAFGAEAFLLAAGPGDKSRIYHTSDFGQHWKVQFTNPEPKGFFDCVAFSDRQHGIAVGDPVSGKFQILRTADGGKNWRFTDSNNMPPALDGEGAFAASNSCLAMNGRNVWFATGGSAARVFHSRDGGSSWTIAETPIVHGTASQGIFSIAFEDATHGVLAGGDYARPEQGGANLAISDDGGKTWKLIAIQPQKYFSAIAYVSTLSAHSILVVGSGANGALKIDLRSWEFFGPTGFNALASSGATVYAVGANGAVARLER